MLKTILREVRQYKGAALLTPLWTTLEVVTWIVIPYITASLIDDGISAGNLGKVWLYGGEMVGMACLSMLFGILAARFAAYSSTGLAANLRTAMYRNIQNFSFSDIDKFSTAGLVTRMTTDVSSIQNAFQMLLRTSFRAPLNMVSALVMCFVIHKKLSIIFLIAMVILSVFLAILITRAAKLFKEILLRVDALNGVVQENVSAIRVVKAYVREDHEISKFDKAALNLYTMNVNVETLYHRAQLVRSPFHCRRFVDDGPAHFSLFICDDGPFGPYDALDDFCPADPELRECRKNCGSN